MKRTISHLSLIVLIASAAGCGNTVNNLLGDMAGGDMEQVTLFKLPTGVWKVSGPVTSLTDGCMVDPNNMANPTAGQIWALQNDGKGGIKLGNPTNPTMPMMPQQPDVDVGTPPQPAQGASCPGGAANPAQCASEPAAMAFNNNKGTLVRDNTVGTGAMGTCTFHRHVVNQLTLTSDGHFTSAYSRTDTLHMTCMQMTDCTTTWSWDFEFVKAFGI